MGDVRQGSDRLLRQVEIIALAEKHDVPCCYVGGKVRNDHVRFSFPCRRYWRPCRARALCARPEPALGGSDGRGFDRARRRRRARGLSDRDACPAGTFLEDFRFSQNRGNAPTFHFAATPHGKPLRVFPELLERSFTPRRLLMISK